MRKTLETIEARGLVVLLLMLLVADAAFIVLHLGVTVTGSKAYLFRVYEEGGFPEMYQYIKWLWIVTALVYYVAKERDLLYVHWILLFAYFLVDDALSAHEAFGRFVEANYAFSPPFNLEPHDVAELLFSAFTGGLLLLGLGWAHVNGSRQYKARSRDLLVLVAALALFGIAVDLVASMAGAEGKSVAFMTIEDSGEMLVASLMVWYVVTLVAGSARPRVPSGADPGTPADRLVEVG